MEYSEIKQNIIKKPMTKSLIKIDILHNIKMEFITINETILFKWFG